jgi:hypothetical protein
VVAGAAALEVGTGDSSAGASAVTGAGATGAGGAGAGEAGAGAGAGGRLTGLRFGRAEGRRGAVPVKPDVALGGVADGKRCTALTATKATRCPRRAVGFRSGARPCA